MRKVRVRLLRAKFNKLFKRVVGEASSATKSNWRRFKKNWVRYGA